MKITAIHVRDFKRIREVRIAPDADRALILIGGDNAAGKSSVLDAIALALGGKKLAPSDPVRHGADDSEIRLELADGNGALIVRRLIAADGDSVIEVRDAFGAVKAPQAVLDRLVGQRFLDPLAFVHKLDEADQRKALLRLVDKKGEIPTLDHKRERAFTRRTEIGRDLKKAEGEAARLPAGAAASPIDVAALLDEDRKLEAAGHEFAKRARSLDAARTASASASASRVRLELEIARLQSELSDAVAKESAAAQRELDARTAVETCPEVGGSVPRRDEIRAEIERAHAHNAKVAAAQAQGERRRAVEAEIKTYMADVASMSAMIDEIDASKAAILTAAKLPVDGLGVSADGITYQGVPFAQASAAEKYKIAIALSIAANPELRDICIRDGALLDEHSLAMVHELAVSADVRLWVERVGDRDPGAVIIHDGMVRGENRPAPASPLPNAPWVAPLVLE